MIPFRVSCFNRWDIHFSTSTSETPSVLQPFLILPDKNQPTVVISDHFLLAYVISSIDYNSIHCVFFMFVHKKYCVYSYQNIYCIIIVPIL